MLSTKLIEMSKNVRKVVWLIWSQLPGNICNNIFYNIQIIHNYNNRFNVFLYFELFTHKINHQQNKIISNKVKTNIKILLLRENWYFPLHVKQYIILSHQLCRNIFFELSLKKGRRVFINLLFAFSIFFSVMIDRHVKCCH